MLPLSHPRACCGAPCSIQSVGCEDDAIGPSAVRAAQLLSGAQVSLTLRRRRLDAQARATPTGVAEAPPNIQSGLSQSKGSLSLVGETISLRSAVATLRPLTLRDELSGEGGHEVG
jgi:hypothetical protein